MHSPPVVKFRPATPEKRCVKRSVLFYHFLVTHARCLYKSVECPQSIIIIMIVYRLHPSADRIRMHKNRLRINGVSASDNGVFDCRARNLAGSVNSSNSFLLSVPGTHTPPRRSRILLFFSTDLFLSAWSVAYLYYLLVPTDLK